MNFIKLEEIVSKFDEIKRRCFWKTKQKAMLNWISAVNWLVRNPEMKLKVNWGHIKEFLKEQLAAFLKLLL